jgi:3-deoxy-manno-octulosonate cytidylyltransferase (CMP-KDO synthetase)
MEYIGIIPARYGSSRFPGKPLCDIMGKPMIWHVYQSVMKWTNWKAVYLATDDDRIQEAAENNNIPCIMTSSEHTDCLDRSAEVASILVAKGKGADRYITIQGDEPLFNVETLNVDLTPSIVNFYSHVHDPAEEADPDAVKVVVSESQRALYFSRFSVPYRAERTRRTNEKVTVYKQIGVYSFSAEMMKVYTSLNSTTLENAEGIGLNRLLENDIDIYMRYTEHDSVSVDTGADRQRIVDLIIARNKHKDLHENRDLGDIC